MRSTAWRTASVEWCCGDQPSACRQGDGVAESWHVAGPAAVAAGVADLCVGAAGRGEHDLGDLAHRAIAADQARGLAAAKIQMKRPHGRDTNNERANRHKPG